MTDRDFIWERREGRDCDGDKFRALVCVHGSGRILARVLLPVAGQEYKHYAMFDCAMPDGAPKDSGGSYDFIDEDSAKAFIERTLLAFDPLAPASAAGAVKESVADKQTCPPSEK
jgi:hypothetical protein